LQADRGKQEQGLPRGFALLLEVCPLKPGARGPATRASYRLSETFNRQGDALTAADAHG